MQEIYFEVPKSTRETVVMIPYKGDYWTFKVVFFELENADYRMVTIIGECSEDELEEVQTLTSNMVDEDHRNEFEFEFKATYDMTVTIMACMDETRNTVIVKY